MKGDHMGIRAASPTQRELPLSNQTRFSQKFKAFVFVGIHGSANVALGTSITGVDFYKLEDFQLNPDRAWRGESAGVLVRCNGCAPGPNQERPGTHRKNS